MPSMTYDGSIHEKEKRDLSAWENLSRLKHDDNIIFFNYKVQKISELKIFERDIDQFHHLFQSAGTVLEVGGGSCWGSYYVKKMYPSARVIGSDIAKAATESHTIWRDFFDAEIDGIHACPSYNIPIEDNSVDLVFCFEAAHHFGRHRQTLREFQRIVRPGGHVVYLNEPICGSLLHPLAHRRVNRRLAIDGVPEDVLIHGKILQLAKEAGFEGKLIFDPHVQNRGPVETIYYSCLGRMPFLQSFMPTTAHFVFEKRPM
jgi:SAM-dependent methyltransferase